MERLATVVAIAVFTLVAAAGPARASFHNWDINEVFSNVDGTIQYIEFFTNGNFEVLVGGEQGVTRLNTVALQSYVIPTNLPTMTAMKSACASFLNTIWTIASLRLFSESW